MARHGVSGSAARAEETSGSGGKRVPAGAQRFDRLEIAELQRLFDAYTVMQAQEALGLDDAVFGQFLPKLKALQELEARAGPDLRRAYDAVDQLLDIRRQARFRVFEQNMERRKLQLMLRARRGAPGQDR